MYQFYYADRAVPFRREACKENIRDYFRITAVRPAMWEEHCLECAAPACFESCGHYRPRRDGRCRRLENGLLTFPEERACCGQGVHVKFCRWGNMMTVLFPAMLTQEDYASLHRKNEKLGKLLSLVERAPLPRSLRWQGIRIPEYLRRRRLRSLTGIENSADAFVFHGYSYTSGDYRLILEIYDGHTPVFRTAIAIHSGENVAVLRELSSACSRPGNLVKLYPEKDLEAELDILWCDFVRGRPVAQPAEKVKCVVWDLDGTLWDGTLAETEDAGTLTLKPGIREMIEELDSRGILQSAASKNEKAAAMAVLERLGVADYFLYPQIHWEPKSGSLEQIAKCLNIGIDSLALVDDTAFEREQVRSVWPQVRVYDSARMGELLTGPEFDVPVTAEGRSRRALYRAQERRSALMDPVHTDMVDFLRSCNLRMELFVPETEGEKLRCYELAARTNQLNMTGKKYTPGEFSAVLARKGHRNFAFSCADDFGSYGIVGFGQYRVEGKTLVFTEFAMSCRVAGKLVESALFAHLLTANGCDTGLFTVQKTGKNALLRETLERIGFRADPGSGETVSYRFTAQLRGSGVVALRVKG